MRDLRVAETRVQALSEGLWSYVYSQKETKSEETVGSSWSLYTYVPEGISKHKYATTKPIGK